MSLRSHEKLWKKLHEIGVSGKIMKVLQSVYNRAFTKIRLLNNELSDNIPITEGLLQGDPLSPLLFNLFINDIEEHLLMDLLPGIKINNQLAIHILLYADDTVVFGKSHKELQMKINSLGKYFEHLGLNVNIEKTKIMIFKRGGKYRKNSKSFSLNGKTIEIVSQYTYLGITFHASMVFKNTASEMRTKATAAINRIWFTLSKGHSKNLLAANKLFDSIVRATLLYNSHIWGLRYLEVIEKAQSHFLKKYLSLSRISANYLTRLECGRVQLGANVWKQCIQYFVKLSAMPNYRLPKACFDKLLHSNPTEQSEKFNWVTQFKRGLQSMNIDITLSNTNASLSVSELKDINVKIDKFFFNEDIKALLRSERNSYYKLYRQNTKVRVYADYLNSFIPFNLKRLIAKIRLKNEYFYVNKQSVSLMSNKICPYCNTNQPDTIMHLVCKCPISKSNYFNDTISKFPEQEQEVEFLKLFYNKSRVALLELAQKVMTCLCERLLIQDICEN